MVLILLFQEPCYDNPEASTIPTIPLDYLSRPLKTFPLLNEIKIGNYLSESNVEGKAYKVPVVKPCQVPISYYDQPVAHFINQRRLEVIKDCVQYIYENKISEARKVNFNAFLIHLCSFFCFDHID